MGNKQPQEQISASEFYLKLYQKLSNSDNLIFSPASLYIALSMTSIGSQGQTLEQFKQLLQFENKEKLALNIKQLESQLVKDDQGIKTQIANKIYCDLPQLGQEYEQSMIKNFGSATEKVDFTNNFEQIRIQINEWVKQKTNQKIQNLLTPNSLNKLTRMVLVNAIYFKGNWQYQFDKSQTHKREFSLEYEKGKKIKVDMMRINENYDYYENKHYQFISIPYKGRDYAMEIILPIKSLNKFELTLSHEVFLQARQNVLNKKVDLYLPKFKIQPGSSIKLKNILSELGIPQAFSEEANFSFMDPSNGISISDVYHKAMIEVNEEGAEALAATAIVEQVKCLPAPCPQFICTKPFIYTITHLPTNTVLFMGKVTDPTKN